MSNLINWLQEAAEGEPIEAIVIGEMGCGDYGSDEVPNYSAQPRGKVLTYEEAKPFIDYEFSSGFGAPSCNAIYAWTKSYILFISQYDGSTCINSIPRNPIDCIPDMPGG